MNALFNKRSRKFRKRSGRRRREKLDLNNLTSKPENCLHGYKSRFFVFIVRSLVLSLPVKWMGVLWDVFQCWRQKHDVPDRIVVLLKDLIAFRKRVVRMRECANDVVSRNASGYMSILYHNKGIDMVNLPRILNNRYVRDAVPNIIQNAAPL